MNIFTHKTDAMRAVLRYVSQHGYTHYTQGACPESKFKALTDKFNDRYAIFMTAQQRYRARLKNSAVSVLIAFKRDSTIEWILLVCSGEGEVFKKEQLLDLTKRSERLIITGYELVQLPRKEAQPSWTYRMTAQTKTHYLEQVKTVIRRKKELEIKQLVHSLKAIPPFRALRKDAYHVINRASGEWVRIMPKTAENPFKSVWIGWVGRYLPAETLPLTALKTKRERGSRA